LISASASAGWQISRTRCAVARSRVLCRSAESSSGVSHRRRHARISSRWSTRFTGAYCDRGWTGIIDARSWSSASAASLIAPRPKRSSTPRLVPDSGIGCQQRRFAACASARHCTSFASWNQVEIVGLVAIGAQIQAPMPAIGRTLHGEPLLAAASSLRWRLRPTAFAYVSATGSRSVSRSARRRARRSHGGDPP